MLGYFWRDGIAQKAMEKRTITNKIKLSFFFFVKLVVKSGFFCN